MNIIDRKVELNHMIYEKQRAIHNMMLEVNDHLRELEELNKPKPPKVQEVPDTKEKETARRWIIRKLLDPPYEGGMGNLTIRLSQAGLYSLSLTHDFINSYPGLSHSSRNMCIETITEISSDNKNLWNGVKKQSLTTDCRGRNFPRV